MPRLADTIFDFVQNKGVDKVFLLPGGGAMYLVDAVSKNKKIDYVAMHHEQAAGIAAEYYARLKDNFGVALVTTGPGATNVITPFVGAWIESIPLLVISGQVKKPDLMSKFSKLRQSGVQEVDIVSLVNNCSKYAITIKDPLKIRYELEKAYHLMMDGRKGPVWLDIPLDVQAFNIPNWSKLEKYIVPKKEDQNHDILLDKIYKELVLTERPLLLIGHGVRLSNAQKKLRKFIEKSKIPSVFTWNACDILEFESRYYVGKPGNVATRAANFAIQSCTMLVSIGARLDNITTAYNIKNFARKAKIKWVLDIDENQLNVCELSGAKKLCIDLNYAIGYLLKKNKLTEKTEWVNHCILNKTKYCTCDGKIPTNINLLTHFEAAKMISDAIPINSTIITGSSGLAIESFYVAYEPKKNQRILLTAGLGAMGYGLPAFIGALEALDNENKKFLIESDGSFMLNLQELQTLKTISKENFKLIILNNNGYCSIRTTQKNYFENNFVASSSSSGLEIPDFKKIALSFGINYQMVDNSNKTFFKEIINKKGPLLIDIKLVEDEALWPKVSLIPSVDGKLISMPIEDMSPLLSSDDLKKALGFNTELLNESIEVRKHKKGD